MKRFLTTYLLVLLVCFGLTSSARAETIDANNETLIILDPGISITCISYFIPDVPNIPDSLVFSQAPEWTNLIPFDYNSAGWDTALADADKTAYAFGPMLTNGEAYPVFIFSYLLHYQWDDADPNYNPNSPVYLDIAFFNNDTLVYDYSYSGVPGSSGDYGDTTWQEQNGGPPYQNPVPEPATICFFGLGFLLFTRKKRFAFS